MHAQTLTGPLSHFGHLVVHVLTGVSYSPHTVTGTWTIVLTVIAGVFGTLFTVRLLAPIRPQTLEEEYAQLLTDQKAQAPTDIVEA